MSSPGLARTGDSTDSIARALLWVAVSSVLFVAALFATLPIVTATAELLGATHLHEMAAWPVVWGALGVVGVMLAGRLAFGAWLPLDRVGLAVTVLGLGVAAALHFALHLWASGRYGYTDPDLVGWTSWLFAVLTAQAVAAFAAFVSPRVALAAPLSAVLLGTAGVVFIVLTNVPGLRDGIRADSWALAAWLGTSGLYAVATGGLVVHRASVSARPNPPG